MAQKIRTAERTADILCCFLTYGTELRVADIVSHLHLDKGTVSRLLSTLAAKRLVVIDPVTRRYRLGPVIAELGNAARSHENLAQLALPSLTWLRDVSGESAGLNVLIGNSRVCVAQVESRQELRRVIDIGRSFPPHAGAAGKTLLAYLSQQALDDLLQRTDLVALTPETITKHTTLVAELAKIRRRGYGMGRGERIPDGAGVAVPVYDSVGKVIASLSLAMPSARYDPRRLPRYIRWLRTAADQISVRLGRVTA